MKPRVIASRITFPPPLTEADMVPGNWRVWWRWNSKTDQWTRHTRSGT